ncbi:putative phage abortive infection protein [Vibrio parahaemolyticus]|uniref:putative phage abortive infection protein n=1 Tax=Vibrio parahaemolyticus TaxID=670 RepID=UPI001E4EF686|nr:putative phage abortive infection protein [Vibrio parahaemolyticus]
MANKYQKLSYKNYSGTVQKLENGTFTGKVLELSRSNTYYASSIEELEKQFKNRVDYFYESCAMLGVEPEPLGRRKPSKVPYLALFFSAIFIMCFLWWFYTSEFPLNGATSKTDVNVEWFDKSGSFFNNFSAPILSFFSFMGLLFTIYQQNRSHQLSLKELALTREELELTRKEIEKTTIANEEQADALRQQVDEAQSAAAEQKALATEQRLATQIQQFETSFYALLSEHNRALDDLISSNKENRNEGLHLVNLGEVEFSFVKRMIEKNSQLRRYFRMLYQLLKFVATNHVENTERNFSEEYLNSNVSLEEKRYSSLVRSMIPNNVLCLLSVNCCQGGKLTNSFRNYFLLLERYGFLEHLEFSPSLLFRPGQLGSVTPKMKTNAQSEIICSYSLRAFDQNESLKSLQGYIQDTICSSRKAPLPLQAMKYLENSVYHECITKCPTKDLTILNRVQSR